MPYVDICMANEEDAEKVFGIKAKRQQYYRRQTFSLKVIKKSLKKLSINLKLKKSELL